MADRIHEMRDWARRSGGHVGELFHWAIGEIEALRGVSGAARADDDQSMAGIKERNRAKVERHPILGDPAVIAADASSDPVTGHQEASAAGNPAQTTVASPQTGMSADSANSDENKPQNVPVAG